MRLAGLLALVALTACGGTRWKEAFDATNTGWLLDVWGPASDDLYAVGGHQGDGTVMHFDGKQWSPEALPGTVPLLSWVHGFGPDDLTVVGGNGTVLHYDGDRWTTQDSFTTQTLWGVWGATPDDLWAVGGNALQAGDATVLRYDGTEWVEQGLPTLATPDVFAFFKVWGTSKDDVYIVGQKGIVLHWDGLALDEIDVGTTEDLISLWGTGADRIAIAGGRTNGVLATWDGVTWTTHDLSPVNGLNGVWMQNDDVVHVAGNGGTLATVDFERGTVTQAPLDTTKDLHAVFGVDRWLTAVGGNLTTPRPPQEGVALRRRLGKDE